MNYTLDWQGHRGCRGIMPENTIEGFLKAIDLGVSTIEMDVIISGDGKVVVSHESYFSNTICSAPVDQEIDLNEENEKSFNLYKMPYEEIAKWDVGAKGNPNFSQQEKRPAFKPLLSDVIRAVEGYTAGKNDICYSIEIKYFTELENSYHPPAEEFAKKVAEVIIAHGIESRAVVQAFNTGVLNALRAHCPEIKCSFLFHDPIELLDNRFKKLTVQPEVFGPHHELVDEGLIAKFHQIGVKVIPWTVNSIDRMIELIEMGIDGIITDFPNWLCLINDK